MARKTLIVLRRDTAATWTSQNPTLASAEMGYETDTGRVKIGDGTTAWTSLEYKNHLAVLKDVNISSLQDGQVLKWDNATSKWINYTLPTSHTQNTDTGTTSTSFIVDSGGTGFMLKDSSGELQVRNKGDTGYANIRVGNLAVTGTTVTINAETVTVDDNVIVLNNNVTGTPTEDAGIEVERGTSTNASLLWDEDTDTWMAGLAGSEVAISLSTHNHSGTYIAVVGSATAGNFPVLTAGGQLNNSSYGPSSFATAGHNHDTAYMNLPATREQGDIPYYNGSSYADLAHGNQYQPLLSGGHGANPSWGDIDGGSA